MTPAKKRSACVRVIGADGRVICVSRKDGRGWCLPGGKVEDGETPLFGAQRELYEETGISVGWTLLHHVYTGPYSGPSGERDVTCFEVETRELSSADLDLGRSPEGLDMAWLDWEELMRCSPFGEFYQRCGAPRQGQSGR